MDMIEERPIYWVIGAFVIGTIFGLVVLGWDTRGYWVLDGYGVGLHVESNVRFSRPTISNPTQLALR